MEIKQKIHKNWYNTYIVPLKKENISQLNVTIIIISLWIVRIMSFKFFPILFILEKSFYLRKVDISFIWGKKGKYFDLPNMAEVGIN
jgi:hypothetical protein